MKTRIHWPLPLTLLVTTALLALSLLGTSSWMETNYGTMPANAAYIASRVAIMIGLGFVLSAVHGRSLFSTLSVVSFLFFLEEVPLKTWLFLHEQGQDPTHSVDLSVPALVTGFIIAYSLSLPIVFAFTLAGRMIHKSLYRNAV